MIHVLINLRFAVACCIKCKVIHKNTLFGVVDYSQTRYAALKIHTKLKYLNTKFYIVIFVSSTNSTSLQHCAKRNNQFRETELKLKNRIIRNKQKNYTQGEEK